MDRSSLHAKTRSVAHRLSGADRIFLRNHTGEVIACDFFVAVTATFRLLYVFVVLDITTRRVLYWNVTLHRTAAWTIQQFRDCVTADDANRFVIHVREAIYAPAVDAALESMPLKVLKTPIRTPQANAFCERWIGTARRECLDWIIPLNERHLRRTLAEWITHYNRERPHAALGPGLPNEPAANRVSFTGHQLARTHCIAARSILGGLHHEYRLEQLAA